MQVYNKTALNACATCSIGQYCCTHLSNLKISELEYKKHFDQYSEYLEVRRVGALYIISSKGEKPCPNWSNNLCNIYDDRPIDCRLYPYDMRIIHINKKQVKLSFHSLARCPSKKELLATEKDAREMISRFAHDIFTGRHINKIKREGIFDEWKRKIKQKVKKSLPYVFKF
jgi:Fe-S-cluster containining protein